MIGVPRRLTSLVAGLACAASVAAAAPVTEPRPTLHYTMVTHRFAVADPRHDPQRDAVDDAQRSPYERSLARNVEWSYPVFDDARDPATPALNAWARHESLKLLLVEVGEADRQTDAQVIANAIASQDFIDAGVDQAWVQPGAALGRYRGITGYSEAIGGSHPWHQVSPLLYDLDRRAEAHVAGLFKPDADDALKDLFDAQPEAACPDAAFEWAQASLNGIDTLTFEYPYRPGRNRQDIDCGLLMIKSPRVARLLKSPRRLSPEYTLVEDAPAR